MQPTLSVMMANYNHGGLVARAIESVVSQSRLPDEYIILDDGSTDNSVQIIESYARRFPFIRLARNERNTGSLAAAQRAARMATGDYLYSGAADDYILPGFFERAMEMAKRYPQAGIIFGRFVAVDPEGNEIAEYGAGHWPETPFAGPKEFLERYLEAEAPDHSLCGATIYRRDALDEVGGFREELGPWCDTFAARAIGLKYGACYFPERVLAWTVLPDSLSHSHAKDPTAMLDIAGRAARLMRSQEFCDRFPEDHVRRWLTGFREIFIRAHVERFREQARQLVGDVNRARGRSGRVGDVLVRLVAKGMEMGTELAARVIAWTLRHYRADVT